MVEFDVGEAPLNVLPNVRSSVELVESSVLRKVLLLLLLLVVVGFW